MRLRGKTTFKIWYFYLAQILTGIVEKRHVLRPFNFFFKFSYCLSLFPIFPVHVNWIEFFFNCALFKILLPTFITQNISVSNESWTWSDNSVWIWKMMVDKIGELHKSSHSQMFWSLFLIKWQAQRDFNTGFFLWILQYLRTLFLKTSANGFF